MASLRELIQKGEVCHCLRAKNLFYQTESEEDSGANGPFWCAQTQSLLGPDGQVSSADDCRPGRSCCQTH
jgi:hypothetical protein